MRHHPTGKVTRLVTGLMSAFLPRFKILAYHSIGETSRDIWEVSSAKFQEQMQYLAKHKFRVMSLEEAFRKMIVGEIPERSIVITFDDGYESLWNFAFPVLKDFGFVATVFLPVAYVGGIDKFSYEQPREHMSLLSWQMIMESQGAGISYASHSMSHKNLISLDDWTLHYELEESKRALATRLGTSFHALAYPFGMYDARVKRVARNLGYDCALGFGNVGSNTRMTDRLEMKREKLTSDMTMEDFAYLTDVGNDVPRKLGRMRRQLS